MSSPTVHFVSALKDALELGRACKDILVVAKEITDSLHSTQAKLTEDAAGVARQEANNFREALRMANASGDALLQRYGALKSELNEFEQLTAKFTKSKKVSRDDVTHGNRMLRSVLQRAKSCLENYPAFKEKLKKAIDLGTQLVEKCKVSGKEAEVSAANTRVGGYSLAGGLGAVAAGSAAALAAGFLAVATGGIGAIVLGIGAVGTRAFTRNRAKQLDSLASQFRALQIKLETDVDRLNRDADKIEGNHELTRLMVEELETKLRLAMEEPATLTERFQ